MKTSQPDKSENELDRQDTFPWQRGKYFATYEQLLGQYIVQSIVENKRMSRLLDLACGNGYLTHLMAPHFGTVVGLDASATHVADAKKTYPGIEFVHALAEEFQGNDPFDTITMVTLLEHVQDPSGLLNICARQLSQEGIIIAHVPNAVAVNRRIAKLMGTLSDEYELSPFDLNIAGHRRSYDMADLVKNFEDAGLKVVKTGGVFYKMLSTPQINWMLEEGPWDGGEFGWGRVGEEKTKDWRKAFCDACYEFGKQRPEDCNVIYAIGQRKG
ncbi:class I SAM-dependent methyltransferase [Desulfobacula sp.]|uniref:class I SAM-dependent methyltransferase n=1 Tax=Desulfobacula sp. TaxID=2593537 RepID=UPI002617A036|nr:class I SAM-dependent methyltransferase [Desulfobacula sp.]